ncbi:hypothetical protein NKH19_20470 [Mesorhizobium sp. M1338]|uniref:hypothetical protein n=1 Tax=unclassified Mesorhizobium TaxID=325217 RepID=UPI0033355B07
MSIARYLDLHDELAISEQAELWRRPKSANDARSDLDGRSWCEGGIGSPYSTVWLPRDHTEIYGKISDFGPRKSQ